MKKIKYLLRVVFLIVLVVGAIWFFNRLEERQSVPVIENPEGSLSIVDSDPGTIPGYSGEDQVILNDNIPCFTKYDLENAAGETYSDLDGLGRCHTAIAMLDQSMTPVHEREYDALKAVTPSGYRQKKYPGIIDSDPPYLYNRCHLIAYAMTGQTANEKNLITGTHHMNTVTMLPYEEQILRYLYNSGNHVLYRVSPYFKGRELVAIGLELEAYSVEDHGAGLCFHVFIYNVQPGIVIDYATGDSWKN